MAYNQLVQVWVMAILGVELLAELAVSLLRMMLVLEQPQHPYGQFVMAEVMKL